LKIATAVIPARYQSTRFPGKPLALILGKPMVQRVYEGARQAKLVDRTIIATDDERILRAAANFGAEAMMTSLKHLSGMERAAEVAQSLRNPIVVNIQGDEPLVTGEMIDTLVDELQDDNVPVVSIMAKVYDLSLIHEPHIVKAVVDKRGYALYFSRAPLPYQTSDFFYQHIGIYGYHKDFLLEFARMKPTRLEQREKLEQLRVLENGFRIKMVEIAAPTLSVDTPEDIIRVEEFLRKKKNG
jgi:3-deoxy-manno-octulosonate cytidylyltransferase (CMP-KDO synthetase)